MVTKFKLLKIYSIIIVSFILLCFQNCEQLGQFSPVNVSSLDQMSLTIIDQNCVQCHGQAPVGVGNTFSDILDVQHLIDSQMIVPGQPDISPMITSIENQSMPVGYSLTTEEITTLKDWVRSLPSIITPVVAANCTLTSDKTNITLGESIILTMTTSGTIDSATINSQSVNTNSGSLQLAPTSTTSYQGTVTNSLGTSVCQSPTITVNPPVVNAPTCILSANVTSNIIPGDLINFSLTITGQATSAKINSLDVSVSNPVLNGVEITTNTSFTANVTGTGGTNSCSLSVTLKQQSQWTKYEYYRAKIGPALNGVGIQSIDSYTNRCAACHTPNPPSNYAQAPTYVIFTPGDTAGNFQKIQQPINGPTKILYLSVPPLKSSLWQFSSGHKPKNPSFTTQELQHITNFVNF